MKIGYIILALVIVVAAGVFALGWSRAPADAERASISGNVIASDFSNVERVAIDSDASSFEFIGYGPGKQHVGSFEAWDAALFVDDGKIVGFSGVLQANSVRTDTERVSAHLQTDDFFDVANYPTIEFTATSLEGDQLTGMLNFHGVEKQITFPVVIDDDSISADFVLDTKPFALKYAKITNEVKITFVLVRA